MPDSKRNGLHRRKKPATKKVSPSTSTPNKKQRSNGSTTDSNCDYDTNHKLTLWNTLKDSPLFIITSVIMMPYFLYITYLYIHLQQPKMLSTATLGLLKLRPAINVTELRQVLIIGSISSGTTQMSYDLEHKLKLEIGHENAETSWSFVRDGTVSWFHGTRYIPRPGIDYTIDKNGVSDGEALFQAIVHGFCSELHPSMGFHPFMYRSNCSIRQQWDPCWKKECIDILKNEWGCALRKHNDDRNEKNNDNNTCETPFRKILHQVRHPLRTIESLVTKFCVNGVEGEVQRPFLIFANVLFPQLNFSEMSCIEATGYYVDEYNSAIIDAKAKGGLIDDIYHVEDVTPCEVAALAGFMDDDAVFTKDHVMHICNNNDSEANKKLKSKKTRYNKGQLLLDWDDLLGGRHGSKKKLGNRDLLKRVKKLVAKLGYE